MTVNGSMLVSCLTRNWLPRRALLAAAVFLCVAQPAAADPAACAFSPGERLAALEALSGELRRYLDAGGAYPASLRLLPGDVLGEIPAQLGDDTLWLWPPAAAPQGDDARLMQGNYASASCITAVPGCAAGVRSVCYVLIDGAGSFCSDEAALDAGCEAP